jgi:hypothetical protein
MPLDFARTSPRLFMRLAEGSQYKTPSDDGSHALAGAAHAALI